MQATWLVIGADRSARLQAWNCFARSRRVSPWLSDLGSCRPSHRDILMPYPWSFDDMRTSTVFTNNRSQAVRLPADARLPPHVKRVEVRVRGAERIITPAGHTWDSFFAPDAPRASDDFLTQRATQVQSQREPL